MDRVNDSSRLGQTHSVTDAVSSANPTCVDQVDFGTVAGAFLSQHLSIDIRMQG